MLFVNSDVKNILKYTFKMFIFAKKTEDIHLLNYQKQVYNEGKYKPNRVWTQSL